MSTDHVQHISVFIERRPAEVYEFAADPRNIMRWARGLAQSELRQEGEQWIASSPMGEVKIQFAPKNPYGVLDHDVTLESGVTVHNVMRVVPHGEGSEFIFTLFRAPEMSDVAFAEDAAAVEKDLQTLRQLLEQEPGRAQLREDPDTDDEQAIRNLVATWMSASQAGDIETVLSLMADDAIFTVSGQEPFGKQAFAAASEGMKGARMEGTNEIRELRVLGDWAYVRCYITMTMTMPGNKPMRRSGYTLTILRKEPDGRWLLTRDANLLALDRASS